jgi:hypothetical protein
VAFSKSVIRGPRLGVLLGMPGMTGYFGDGSRLAESQ